MDKHPFIDLRSMNLDRETGRMLDKEISKKIEGICIGNPEPGLLTVVVNHPDETYIYDLIELSTTERYKARLLKGDPESIQLAWEYIFNIPQARWNEDWKTWLDSQKFADQSLGRATRGDGGDSVEVTGSAVSAADQIIKEAISVGASDIHLESYSDGLVVRYRQDGVLRTVNHYSEPKISRAIIKRLKVMGEMDVTQERNCQGGRIPVQIGDLAYTLRVSVIPVGEGEGVVLRILSKGAFKTELSCLGLREKALKRYSSMLETPFGLLLACGPTGSGKSTTLYASLQFVSRPDRKLLTVEDPVEYQMAGVMQVQVNNAPKDADRKVTFSRALREFLRHDPDVILVGEIRDEETAKVSVQAALTGHLVLSTIHTNDAVGVVNRLKDMGVPSYLIASTLIGSVAQRLVRKLCPECALPADLSPEEQTLFEHYKVPALGAHKANPEGCRSCRGEGYKGRVGLYEVMYNSLQLKELIETESTAVQMSSLALEQGMETLVEDGLQKVAQGLVSLSEVKRVCRDDVMALGP
jgi:type II secretory ATPase GspE/PulE/Tfp pilus assembly ATPase PilB-like protein